MSIFRRLHVPVRGRLEMAELRAQWPRYALRLRDLDRSVDRLESLGFVEVDHTRNGLKYVVLTEMGHRSVYTMLGSLESLLTWPRRLRREFRRFRIRVAQDDRYRRRTDRKSRDAAPH